MTKLKVKQKRKINGEQEALDILQDVRSSLNKEERIAFFYFFVEHSFIFYLHRCKSKSEKEFRKITLDNYLQSYKSTFERVINIPVDFKKVDSKILDIWKRYIKNNPGTSANYWGLITVHLLKSLLENRKECDEIYREAKILYNNDVISGGYIDILCIKKTNYDLYECKHKVSSQYVDIIVKIKKLKVLTEKIKKIRYSSDIFLATLDFSKKERITNLIERLLDEKHIINAENIFGIVIIR